MRPLIGEKPMTSTERWRRWRARRRGELAPWQPKPRPQPPQFEDTFLADLQVLNVDDLPGPPLGHEAGGRRST
jgi:hypothetical protein